ncbi:Uncharacterized protein FWK35_00037746, partial [Aphis craccivora]
VICSLHFAPYHYNNNSTDKCKLKPDTIPLSNNASRKRLFDGKKSLSISEDLGVEPLI